MNPRTAPSRARRHLKVGSFEPKTGTWRKTSHSF